MAGVRKFNQRKRNTEKRKRIPFVIIGCEGNNKTEKIYFRNFNSRKCMIKFSRGNSTDPKGIVQELINFIHSEVELEENDKIYAIFDTDVGQNKNDQIDAAKKLAKESGIEIITSTPTFEVWFLLHFGFTTKTFATNSELQEELKRHIPNYLKKDNTYLIIKDLTNQAIKNAKELESYQLKLGKILDSEKCNPHSSVYKIVEELIVRNNE